MSLRGVLDLINPVLHSFCILPVFDIGIEGIPLSSSKFTVPDEL
jgi:hypothetical protein